MGRLAGRLGRYVSKEQKEEEKVRYVPARLAMYCMYTSLPTHLHFYLGTHNRIEKKEKREKKEKTKMQAGRPGFALSNVHIH